MQGKCLCVVECGFPWETPARRAVNEQSGRMRKGGDRRQGQIGKSERGGRKEVETEGPISLFSEAMTAGSVLPHMTKCCGEECLSWKPVSKGGQLIVF